PLYRRNGAMAVGGEGRRAGNDCEGAERGAASVSGTVPGREHRQDARRSARRYLIDGRLAADAARLAHPGSLCWFPARERIRRRKVDSHTTLRASRARNRIGGHGRPPTPRLDNNGTASMKRGK